MIHRRQRNRGVLKVPSYRCSRRRRSERFHRFNPYSPQCRYALIDIRHHNQGHDDAFSSQTTARDAPTCAWRDTDAIAAVRSAFSSINTTIQSSNSKYTVPATSFVSSTLATCSPGCCASVRSHNRVSAFETTNEWKREQKHTVRNVTPQSSTLTRHSSGHQYHHRRLLAMSGSERQSCSQRRVPPEPNLMSHPSNTTKEWTVKHPQHHFGALRVARLYRFVAFCSRSIPCLTTDAKSRRLGK